MTSARVVLVLAAVLLLTVEARVRSQTPKDVSRPTNIRHLLGGRRQVRLLKEKGGGGAGGVVLTDPTPLLLAEVVRELGGRDRGPCHVLVYHDPRAAPPEELAALRAALEVPVIMVDVSKLKFPLITRARRRVPLLDLLSRRPDNRCRLLVAWASTHYQRGLLLMARAEPGVLSFRDTLVLAVDDQRLDRFLPQLRRRILVKRRGPRRGRGRRDLRPARFLVEGACEMCPRYSLSRLGEWHHPGGWTWGGATSRGRALSGAVITVSYTPSVPNIFPTSSGGETRLEGVELRLLHHAAKALNFSFRLVMPSDGEWGRKVNGTWTGKVGEVVGGRADLALGGLVYTEERHSVGEYSVLFHNELWGIVCPLSARLPMWPYIMFPFRAEEAPSVFTFLVLLHLMAFLVGTLVGSQERNGPVDPLTQSLIRAIRAGVSLYFRLMACLYFWNLYYCIIKPKFEPPVRTSTALLQSGYSWGLVTGTTVPGVLASSRDPAHRDLASGAAPLASIHEGFQRLREESLCLVGVPKRYAFATIATRHTTQCGEPGLQVSGEDLNSVLGGWMMPRGSPLLPHINPIIRRLQGFGLLEHWRRELHELLITRAPRELPCLNPPVAPLSLSDLRLAFFVLLCGWGLAGLVFLAELLSRVINDPGTERTVVRRDAVAPTTPPFGSSGISSSSLRRWLRTLVSPVPSVDVSAKEAAFRRQLDYVLRGLWNAAPP